MLCPLAAAILIAPAPDGAQFRANPRYNLLAGSKYTFGLSVVDEICDVNSASFRFSPEHDFALRCVNSSRGELEFNLTVAREFIFLNNSTQLFAVQILPAGPSQSASVVEKTATAVAYTDGAVFYLTARDAYGNAIAQLCSTAAVQVSCTCQCALVSAVLEGERCALSLSLNLLVFAKNVKIAFSSYGVPLGGQLALTVRFGSAASVWINATVGGLLMLCSLLGYWWAFLRKRGQR